MIGHQAIGINLTPKLTFKKRQILPIIIVVIITNEYCLAVMTALNNMMRKIGNEDSC